MPNTELPSRSGGAPIPPFLYGTAWKEMETERCVDQALQAGFRGIDTANQRKHYYEAGVGHALNKMFSQGKIARQDLFIQSKFTFLPGQDPRLPYDPSAPIATQVRQSFSSSLDHLGVETLDSYLLHGPSSPTSITEADREAWRAMESLLTEGRTRFLGVSNVRLRHLRFFCEETAVRPAFVQNRCFARTGWDSEIRAFCRHHQIVYQGFSLLTANTEIFTLPKFAEVVRRTGKTPAQVVFRFALQSGILPLTGATNPHHMREDLDSLEFELPGEDVKTIENLMIAF